jgi:hypothetical protein
LYLAFQSNKLNHFHETLIFIISKIESTPTNQVMLEYLIDLFHLYSSMSDYHQIHYLFQQSQIHFHISNFGFVWRSMKSFSRKVISSIKILAQLYKAFINTLVVVIDLLILFFPMLVSLRYYLSIHWRKQFYHSLL